MPRRAPATAPPADDGGSSCASSSSGTVSRRPSLGGMDARQTGGASSGSSLCDRERIPPTPHERSSGLRAQRELIETALRPRAQGSRGARDERRGERANESVFVFSRVDGWHLGRERGPRSTSGGLVCVAGGLDVCQGGRRPVTRGSFEKEAGIGVCSRRRRADGTPGGGATGAREGAKNPRPKRSWRTSRGFTRRHKCKR